MKSLCLALAVTALFGSFPGGAVASGAGAIALTFNTSARAEGMGGAGVANVWDGDTNLWANPALLGFRPGVRFGTMHSRLAAGLADNIFIDKQELTLGYAGIGLLYAEAPFDNVHLDMGAQQGTDEAGNPVGVFESWQKSQAFGLGVGVTQTLDRFVGTRLNRWFDVGLGYVWRSYEEKLAPGNIIQDVASGTAKMSTHDYGWVARVTPLNTLEQIEATADAPLGLTAEATYGWAKTNATDEFLVHPDADQADPMPTAYLSGWAVRAAIVPGPDLLTGLPPLLQDALTPLFAWTYAEQTAVPGYVWADSLGTYVYDRDDTGDRDAYSRGHEFLLLNVFYLRHGHYTELVGDIDDSTDGWGVNLQAGRYGGVRYDKATVPQAKELPDVERDGWHFWVDVMAILGRE